uniref:Ams2/SPT21 N-terminal domain-containing protein n=1 Tax=Podospora anserina (strain S / ATCC MYA-4624 / DSM 980 / FGSC 10383) TaxID=515849 RepID=A0A090CD26_PODAN|nr:Putative protein of unknown function [Podospora anserina S mat+]
MATPTNSWQQQAPSHHMVAQPAGVEDFGVQTRPMGLKVQYTFDRDSQVNCLARWPHLLHIQTIPLDERTTIGVVDLRTCLQAVAQSSPEIVNQEENDYSVYAYDFSEPDVPLVGQGMLSRGLDPNNEAAQQQLVPGRVTRNLLALLSSGSRETLEVKLKLTMVAKAPPRPDFSALEGFNLSNSSQMHVDDNSEWNSFVQSSQMFGQNSNVAQVPSPALPPAPVQNHGYHHNQHNPHSQPNQHTQHNHHFSHPMHEPRPMEMRSDSAPPYMNRPSSIPPPEPQPAAPTPPASHGLPGVATVPDPPRTHTPIHSAPSPAPQPQPTENVVEMQPQARPSRPSSRTSTRSRRQRPPTGRPRGRPRKSTAEGNTSAAEEATDGDEGPRKKRAKVIRADYAAVVPFGSAPDSLRVAASTSGSLRTMRPIGSGNDAPTPNHLQDVPRAPTPVPDGALLQQQQRRRMVGHKARSESVGMENIPVFQHRQPQLPMHEMSQDARSPVESFGQSPDQGYSPEDSVGDLGSSPPVPRTTPYLRSSPPASSPILPPMPMRNVDSGFMSGGLDDFFDEDDMMPDLPPPRMQELSGPMPAQMQIAQPVPVPMTSKPNSRKNSRVRTASQQQEVTFQEVNPGPPELLPTKSLFNPAGRVKTLNRPTPPPTTHRPSPPPASHQAVERPTASIPSNQPAPKKRNARSLKRSHTAPNPVVSEQEAPVQPAQAQPTTQHYGLTQESALPPHFEQPPGSMNGSVRPTADLDNNHVGNGFARASEPAQSPREVSVPAAPLPVMESREVVEPCFHQQQPLPPTSRPPSRPASQDPGVPTVPASDVGNEPILTLPQPFMSEAPCPPSDFDAPRYSKNLVKKQTIKERLESAIMRGESPPFCNNCGAIETPTWRKIWIQEHKGIPPFYEFSDKPGFVTMIDILERDAEGQPAAYRLVKKNLGTKDDKKVWVETLLCNPCGIWLAKFRNHRPPDRWEKDAARLNQSRKRREGKGKKKSRAKSDGPVNPTSEAYFTTDPAGPLDHESPEENIPESIPENGTLPESHNTIATDDKLLNLRSSPKQRLPGSTHSRGSGTADSPIAVEDDLGSTRRLLFPSPRKDAMPRVLGELSANATQTVTHGQVAKSATSGKENHNTLPARTGTPANGGDQLDQELFGTPPRCPSTPPPSSTAAGVFRTPTRPTPSHRPITRSVSRSMRSHRSIVKSPIDVYMTARRITTPRSGSNHGLLAPPSSSGRRRSPRHAPTQAHFVHDDDAQHFESPFTANLAQLLSEANNFTTGSPSHRLPEIDLGSLQDLDEAALAQQLLESTNAVDFDNLLGTELAMQPSSPPSTRRKRQGGVEFGAPLGENTWAEPHGAGKGY